MRKQTVIAVIAVLAAGSVGWYFFGGINKKGPSYKPMHPFYGAIENSITATGNVQPQNGLEVKPPVGGRIEKILVEEGQSVKIGDVLVVMSSTDRAALMDAARAQGESAMKEWEDVYKPTPLIATIDGFVIIKAVEPGQTVTSADAVLVIADRLIIKAQVDETDIGKVKLGQDAVVTLDAYPNLEVAAKVDHVAYASTIVNNVTTYAVDIVSEKVPDVFRSGMSANVKIVQERKDGLLLIPQKLVKKENGKDYVLLGRGRGNPPLKKEVTLGVSDYENVQVLGGLTAEDKVLEEVAAGKSSKSKTGGKNPFMPAPRGGGRGGH